MIIHAHILAFNEEKILPFTLDYYSSFCKKIFVYDNMSTDNSDNIYKEYPKVIVKKWNSNNEINELNYIEIKNTAYKISRVDKADWVIVCDMDEFIYARKDFKTIKQYLCTLDDSVSQVLIPWKIFGSNGYNTINQSQPESIIQNFTKRINYNKSNGFQGVIKQNENKYSLTKSIVKTKYLIEFRIHSHITNNIVISPDHNKDFIEEFSGFNIFITDTYLFHKIACSTLILVSRSFSNILARPQ
jgi:hypothetical protein